MPTADQISDELDPIKLLLIGNTKAGKTDYLLRAAEAGFNVILLDGDIAARTLRKMVQEGRLSKAAAARIFYFSIPDHIDDNGNYVSSMCDFFVKFTTAGKFLWNDSISRPFVASQYKPDEGHEIWEIYPSRIGIDTLLVMDSWTALITSVLHWKADSLNIDLGEIEKLERDMYTGSGHKATQFLQLLKAIRCHLGVICHAREYVKRVPPKGAKGTVQEKDMIVESVQQVPISTSNPHAMTMGKSFTDIGWIDLDAMGRRTIDFRPSDKRVIGGALNISGNVDELTFAKLIQHSGGSIPENPSSDSWLKRYGPGEYELPQAKILGKPATPAAAQQNSSLQPKPSTLKIGGIIGNR